MNKQQRKEDNEKEQQKGNTQFKEQYKLENTLCYMQAWLVCENESCMCPRHHNDKTDWLFLTTKQSKTSLFSFSSKFWSVFITLG